MRASIDYRDRRYGNAVNANDYEIHVDRAPGSRIIRTQFVYAKPAEGFGVGSVQKLV